MLQCDKPLNHWLKLLANFLKILELHALQGVLHEHCRLMNLSPKKQPPPRYLQSEFESLFGASGADLRACLSWLSSISMAIDPMIHQYIYCIKVVLTHYGRGPSWISLIQRHQLSYLLIRFPHSFQILVQVLNFISRQINPNFPEKLFNLLQKLNVVLG